MGRADVEIGLKRLEYIKTKNYLFEHENPVDRGQKEGWKDHSD